MEQQNPEVIINLLLGQISSLSFELATKDAEIIALRKEVSDKKGGE